MITTLCFDLDNTLYKAECGLLEKVDKNIIKYLIDQRGIAEKDVEKKRRYFYMKYGSTLNGLCQEDKINPFDYLEYIHNISPNVLPGPDMKLKKMLQRINLRKVVVTNSYSVYARKVLSSIGILELFDAVYDTVDMGFLYKNSHIALKKIIDLNGGDASQLILVDDDKASIEKASSLGIVPIYLNYRKTKHVYKYEINDIYEIENILNDIGEN